MPWRSWRGFSGVLIATGQSRFTVFSCWLNRRTLVPVTMRFGPAGSPTLNGRAPPQPDPLLPLAVQRAHGMPSASPSASLEQSRLAIRRLVEGVDDVVLSSSEIVHEHSAQPSPLILSYPVVSATDLVGGPSRGLRPTLLGGSHMEICSDPVSARGEPRIEGWGSHAVNAVGLSVASICREPPVRRSAGNGSVRPQCATARHCGPRGRTAITERTTWGSRIWRCGPPRNAHSVLTTAATRR